MNSRCPSGRLALAASLLGGILYACTGGSSDSRAAPPPPDLADHLIINEAYTGRDAFVEVINPTICPIPLTGWQVHFYEGGVFQGSFPFPAGTILGAGAISQIREDTGIDNSPAEFFIGFLLPWDTSFPLEVVVIDPTGQMGDYLGVNMGGLNTNLPPSMSFSGQITQGFGVGEDDVYRAHLEDNDAASDFRIGVNQESGGSLNPGQVFPDATASMNHVVINEVFSGEPDFVELMNPTPCSIILSSWSLEFYDT
ncbi:MAG: hypothetical protein O6952_10265, partial [Planctomycetota bacterium]|nr:hypothetical protein [Planctomycetota bacterium]